MSMLAETRARATDPITSHMAAAHAAFFAGSHAARVRAALRRLGPAPANRIAAATGLTVVQVARRLPERERAGPARVVTQDGQAEHDGKYRLWEAA